MRIALRKKRRGKEFICIACPLGCTLTVRAKGGELERVTGNRCKRGIAYARQEVTGPRRMVTTTVRIQGAPIGLLPVKTRSPVPKDSARDVVVAASRVLARAPVRAGQTILADVCGTGVDLVASRSCLAATGDEEAGP